MNVTYFLVSLGLFLFCIYMLRYALRNYARAKASNNWASITGEIVRIELWGKRKIDGKMVDSEHVRVVYKYCVNDETFSGNKAAFYTLHYPETLEFVKRYPQGSIVPVFYNPKAPEESVILPGLHPQKPNSEIWLAGIGVVISLAVLVGIYTDRLI